MTQGQLDTPSYKERIFSPTWKRIVLSLAIASILPFPLLGCGWDVCEFSFTPFVLLIPIIWLIPFTIPTVLNFSLNALLVYFLVSIFVRDGYAKRTIAVSVTALAFFIVSPLLFLAYTLASETNELWLFMRSLEPIIVDSGNPASCKFLSYSDYDYAHCIYNMARNKEDPSLCTLIPPENIVVAWGFGPKECQADILCSQKNLLYYTGTIPEKWDECVIELAVEKKDAAFCDELTVGSKRRPACMQKVNQ